MGNASEAQLVERLTVNQMDVGSIPTRSAKNGSKVNLGLSPQSVKLQLHSKGRFDSYCSHYMDL